LCCIVGSISSGLKISNAEKGLTQANVAIVINKPCRSWGRGTYENTNGLLRQYFLKGTGVAKVSDAAVLAVQQKLNRRQRKCLGFQTPLDVLPTPA
jgi:IS30 family transposase